jgi:peroxin-5
MAKRKQPVRAKSSSVPDFFDLLRRGTHALQAGQAEEARKLLEQAHKLKPEQAEVTLNLAGAYILTKRYNLAVSLLETLSGREPDNPMVWTNLGAAYLGNPILAKDQHHERAIAAFKKAFDLNPRTPHIAYNLGLIYKDRNEFEPALHWFQEALIANPNDKDARRYVELLTADDE